MVNKKDKLSYIRIKIELDRVIDRVIDRVMVMQCNM